MTDESGNSHGGNILIVDDVPDNLRLLVNDLSSRGYKVRPVSSGKLALSGARRVPPDLILLDVNMPEMDGFEVCAALKADDVLRDIPVIFVSALHETFDKVRALSAGGVDYIMKPFQLEEVLARIETHLGLYRLQKERIQMISELREALDKVKLLSGLIPICSGCKQIRDDSGFWKAVETYVAEHSEAEFSHSICPECMNKLYPEWAEDPPG